MSPVASATVALALGLSCTVGLAAATTENAATLPGEFYSEVKIAHDYFYTSSNITYRVANNVDLKLDVYVPPVANGTRPTLIYIHGGGWMGSFTKESFPFFFLPFLGLNWVVVNVEYRPSSVSLAPAAVEDCLCAMRWVIRHAETYKIDTRQMVIMGNSSGGHLALTTGFIPRSDSGLSGPCSREDAEDQSSMETIHPAAIVNWYGITDVADLIEGENRKQYAAMWIGNQSGRLALARSVSPLTYVRPGLPPVITVHGDHDPNVPYSQAVRLHAALTKAGVANKLVTIYGGGHGFDLRATTDAYAQIFEFLDEVGLNTRPEK